MSIPVAFPLLAHSSVCQQEKKD